MRLLAWTTLVLSWLGVAAPVHACNVPVFRYALEHWTAELYPITLYHRGPLDAADLERIDALEKASPNRVKFHSIDLAVDSCEKPPTQLPWLVVGYPASANKSEAVWEGPLTDDSAAQLLDSPIRRELARRLMAGQSGVWLLLESGAAETDDALARRIESHSRLLEASLKLPELSKSAEDSIRDDVVPLRLSFSVLRVSRSDPAEQMLVQTLLGSEQDLEGRKEPLLFPVFARGRVLYALVGAGINEVNLTKAAEFLISCCSCKVKEAHPGVDLLLTADWPNAVDETPTASSTVDGEPVMRSIPLASTSPPAVVVASASDPQVFSRGWLLGGIVVAGLLTLVTGQMVWRKQREMQS